MDFDFTEEQTLLENMVTSFVRDSYPWEVREAIVKTEEGWKQENWNQFAELGLLGVPFAEEFGGLGGSVVDTMIVMEQFGKGLVVEPYMPSVILSGGLITSLGSKEQIDSIVPTIISGETRYAFAHSEPQSRFDLFDIKSSASLSGDEYILNGFKSVVFGGPMATHLIISARTSGEQRDKEGITLFLVDKNAEGITTQDYPTIDEYRASEVVLENLKVSKDMVLGEVGKAYDAIDEVVDKATIAVCAEAVGALQVLKDSTIDYCKNRKQFGQPIGKNQSIQHRLVDMMIEYEQSKSILYMACTVDLSDATERRKAVSGAKARIGKAIKFVGENAIQLHGGMGMVDEYMVSHYFKRATMLGILFGNEDYHMKRYSEITQADVIKITDAKASSIAFN